jgi:peptidyl-prolyl cis-trans isomerase B (cyclophilin B)
MNCKNCNTKIKKGEIRCSKCGKKVERKDNKKLITIILFAVAIVLLAGILIWYFTSNANSGKDNTKTTEPTGTIETHQYEKAEAKMTKYDSNYKQFDLPKDGEEIAVLHTNMGDIYLRLFEDAAPKAVENFKTHIKDGYYDGLIFHRVIKDFMIQGGDPEGAGYGGESIWGKAFEDEFSKEYHPFRGALCMANSGANTNGSQFFIVQKGKASESDFPRYEAQYGLTWSEKFQKIYEEVGGAPWLEHSEVYNGHTVFGQTFCGLNVVDDIANVQTANSSTNKPIYDVVIEKAEIIKYKEADFK